MPVIFRYKGYRFFFIRMRVTRLSRRMFISETLRLKRNFGWFTACSWRVMMALTPERYKSWLVWLIPIRHCFWRLGMSISAKRVSFDDTTMWVELSDARIIGVPLAGFPVC